MKKLALLLILLFGIGVVTVGCGGEETTQGDTANVDTNKTKLTLEIAENQDNGKLDFVINTNLPDGTEGMVTLSNEKIGYTGQTKVVIKDGSCQTETFSNKGEPLVGGIYKLVFSTSLSNLQPESVQKAIGEDYKNIESEYLSTSDLGTSIVYEREITVDGGSVSEEDIVDKNEEHRIALKALYDKINNEYLKHKSSFNAPAWAEFSRDIKSEFDSMEKEISDFSLKITLGDIKQLHSEYGKILQGREGDPDYFKNEIEKNL